MTEANPAADGNDEKLMTGVDYSVILVRFTGELLYGRNQKQPTHEDIAEHLGTTAEMVTALMRGERIILGPEPFKRIASQNVQTVGDFQRDLIKWHIGRTGPEELLS